MDGKKLLPAIGSVLCVALAVWLAAAAIGIYREGLARQEADPLEPIWSPELVAERLLPIAPLFLLTAALPIAGAVVRSRDGNGRNGETERGPERDGGGRIGEAERAPLSDRKALRTALLLAAVALLAAGAFNGSARDVFGKAVRICTECIGLG